MRRIREIAAEIRKEWKNVHYTAVPYLNAMFSLNTMEDSVLHDDAPGIVLRFLGNAVTWRGEAARRIKKELNDMLKSSR